jgi:hypothetical protein
VADFVSAAPDRFHIPNLEYDVSIRADGDLEFRCLQASAGRAPCDQSIESALLKCTSVRVGYAMAKPPPMPGAVCLSRSCWAWQRGLPALPMSRPAGPTFRSPVSPQAQGIVPTTAEARLSDSGFPRKDCCAAVAATT